MVLHPDVGPWRSTCLLKCEVSQTARHQIISEWEMFDCYFSLLRLLWFGFNCGSFHLPLGCPFCSSACSVAEISCLSNFVCGPPHDGEGCCSLDADALARLRTSFCLLVSLTNSCRAKELFVKHRHKGTWFSSQKVCWILRIQYSKTQKDNCTGWVGLCCCSSKLEEMVQLSSMTRSVACAGSETLLGKCYCPL